jgi:hypothetical protein
MARKLPPRWCPWVLAAAFLCVPEARADEPSRPVTILLFEAPGARARPLAEALRLYTQDVPCRVSSAAWPGSADEALALARREGAAFALWMEEAPQPGVIEVRRLDPPSDHRVPISPDDVRMRYTPAALRIRAFVVAQARAALPVTPPAAEAVKESSPAVNELPVPAPSAPAPPEPAPVPPTPAPAPAEPRPVDEPAPARPPSWLWLEARGGASFDLAPVPMAAVRASAWPLAWLGAGLEGGWRRGPQASVHAWARYARGGWAAWAGPRLAVRYDRARSSGTSAVRSLGLEANVGWRLGPSLLVVGGLAASGAATGWRDRDGLRERWSGALELTAGVAWEPF